MILRVSEVAHAFYLWQKGNPSAIPAGFAGHGVAHRASSGAAAAATAAGCSGSEYGFHTMRGADGAGSSSTSPSALGAGSGSSSPPGGWGPPPGAGMGASPSPFPQWAVPSFGQNPALAPAPVPSPFSLAPTTLPTGAPAAAAAAAAVGPPLKVVLAAKLVAANDGGATTVHPKGRIATFLGAQTVDAAVTRFRALGSTGEQGEQWAFITSMESPAQEYLDGASLLSDLPLPAMPLPGGTSVRHDVLVRGRTLVTLCVRLPDAAALLSADFPPSTSMLAAIQKIITQTPATFTLKYHPSVMLAADEQIDFEWPGSVVTLQDFVNETGALAPLTIELR